LACCLLLTLYITEGFKVLVKKKRRSQLGQASKVTVQYIVEQWLNKICVVCKYRPHTQVTRSLQKAMCLIKSMARMRCSVISSDFNVSDGSVMNSCTPYLETVNNL
jgi:hypothetical protein